MRKFLFGMLAAGALFTTACMNEGLNTDQNDVQVSFALGLEGALETRSANEMNADVLMYSLFDAEGQLVSTINDAVDGKVVINNAFEGGASENVSLTLVKGQTYTVVFWAQNSACDAYNVAAEADGLKVAVDYKGVNNDETRDAFFASETFTVEGDVNVDVVLKRPFAQINLGVSMDDWNAAVASGLNVTESKVVIKNAATSINLLDGSVAGEAVVTYDFAGVPTEATKADNVKTLVVNEQNYKWLSMSYILTDEAKTTLDSDGLRFTLNTADGGTIVLDEGLHNVPVQRNWRTNVVGDILTGNVNLSVSVDPVYYSTSTVGNVTEFYAALNDRNIQVIKLLPGTYDIVHVHMKGTKYIESVDHSNPAVIKGILAAAAPLEFNYVNFDASSNTSLTTTGHQYIDRMERKSVVPIYAAKVKFTNCNFVNLYGTNSVVATNYQAHKKNTMLEIDNCTFQGFAYAFYSRALVSVTNCTFDQTHTTVNPRSIFLYGLGDGSNGKVIFKNNKAIGKTSYTMQMSSSNYDYKNINFDVQNNVNFAVDGAAFLPHPDRDFTGCTFAEGSETFSF